MTRQWARRFVGCKRSASFDQPPAEISPPVARLALSRVVGVSTKTIGNVEAGKSDRPRLYGLALSALVAERIATSPAGGLE